MSGLAGRSDRRFNLERKAKMTLAEIIKTIVGSNPDDWHCISCWGGNSGPSYRGQWEQWNAPDQGKAPDKWFLERKEHSNIGVLKSNAAITMAVGLEYLNDFKEPWANQFPDPRAHGQFADVFFQGALVYRVHYVVVDGGRGWLPLPRREKDGSLLVPKSLAAFMEIVKQITGGSASDDGYLGRSGMKLTDDVWPQL